MWERLTSVTAAAAGYAATLKLCCVLPALFSTVGLAGTAAALYVTRWLAPALALPPPHPVSAIEPASSVVIYRMVCPPPCMPLQKYRFI